MMQERKQKGKILVFSSREICYLSSNFFANQIGAAFEELGYDIKLIFDIVVIPLLEV